MLRLWHGRFVFRGLLRRKTGWSAIWLVLKTAQATVSPVRKTVLDLVNDAVYSVSWRQEEGTDINRHVRPNTPDHLYWMNTRQLIQMQFWLRN